MGAANEYRYEWNLKDKPEESLAYMEKQLKEYPWDITVYERAIELQKAFADHAGSEGKTAERDHYADAAMKLYHTVLERKRLMEAVPKSIAISIEFGVTPGIASNIGQLQFAKKDYKAASDTLRSALSDKLNDPENRTVARWYLAALAKQGALDPAWMDKLLAKDPGEKEQIEKILQSS